MQQKDPRKLYPPQDVLDHYYKAVSVVQDLQWDYGLSITQKAETNFNLCVCYYTRAIIRDKDNTLILRLAAANDVHDLPDINYRAVMTMHLECARSIQLNLENNWIAKEGHLIPIDGRRAPASVMIEVPEYTKEKLYHTLGKMLSCGLLHVRNLSGIDSSCERCPHQLTCLTHR